MTVMAVEQTGKSSIWKWGLLWIIEHDPCPCLIVYPSDADAVDTNRDSFKPLMKGIPRLAMEIDRPNSERGDCFKFSSCSVYFMGAGNDIISKPLRIVVGDEPDFWVIRNRRVSNLDNLDKRGRTFHDAKRVLVCSPTTRQGPINREFSKSSKGFWHLRCLGCGKLSMRSADIHNLQWSVDDENGRAVNSSIRLICPECRREHVENEKREMNLGGGYIHEHQDLIESHVGYQWGALASQFPGLRWALIAEKQIEAGKSASPSKHMFLDNSLRGLPYSIRKQDGPLVQTLRRHCAQPPGNDALKYRFFMADTQDNCFYWIIRGVDANDNSYLLAWGKAADTTALDHELIAERCGKRIDAALIDSGGHRAQELYLFCRDRSAVMLYKGGSSQSSNILWQKSTENRKLIIGNKRETQNLLLSAIYDHVERKSYSYWYLPFKLGQDYVEQITDVQPPDRGVEKRDSLNETDYKLWKSKTGNDHYFDCERMFFIARGFFIPLFKGAEHEKETRKAKRRDES